MLEAGGVTHGHKHDAALCDELIARLRWFAGQKARITPATRI